MDITFNDILRILRRAWILLLVVTIVGGSIAFCYTSLTAKPTYSTTAKVLAEPDGEIFSNASTSSINYAHSLFPTFIEMFQVTDVIDAVRTDMNSREITSGVVYDSKLKNKYTFSFNDQSLVINIKCVADNALDAVDLMNSMITHGIEYISSGYYNNVKLKVMEKPSLTTVVKHEAPVVKNAVIAMVAAFLLTCIAVILHEVLNTRIKNEKDIMEKYDLPVLGLIPVIEDGKKATTRKAQEKR